MKKIYFLLLLSTAIVFAAQTATVTGLDPNGDGFLSLRKKPKQREIGKLYNGDKVEILSQSGKYYKVKDVKSGMIGYAHSNWIRKTSHSTTASTSTSQKQGTVHGLDPNGDGFLSVRSKPKGKKIGELRNGDKVKILNDKGKWYKIKTASSGQVGWAHGNWIRKTSNNSVSKIAKLPGFFSPNKELNDFSISTVQDSSNFFNLSRVHIYIKFPKLDIKIINKLALDYLKFTIKDIGIYKKLEPYLYHETSAEATESLMNHSGELYHAVTDSNKMDKLNLIMTKEILEPYKVYGFFKSEVLDYVTEDKVKSILEEISKEKVKNETED